ncbi:MAG: bifunctional DNA-formamidopyrimidine glycosylase/DNA-(apurinic or apyrimidinic site) lyase [Gammaproteobacteria bacterium]
MPELPEVETTRRALAGTLEGRRIHRLVVREPRLRQPIPTRLPQRLAGARIEVLERRAKYLLMRTEVGSALIHLGMSGSLRITDPAIAPEPHDHYDLILDDGLCVRYRDPRRFGLLLWAGAHPEAHRLLRDIGPEPFAEDFAGEYLYAISRARSGPVKSLLMDSHVVAGVGNIYASEALYRARIHPRRPARRVGLARYTALAVAVRGVLIEAIEAGGTTLRDFYSGTGTAGYFRIQLNVYDREGEPCARCGTPIRRLVIAQRASYFCPRCQH